MTRDMKPALRWFGAEFLVVVTGVLVALAMQAGYQRGQARRHEREYLNQLMAELDQTVATMLSSDTVLQSSDHSVVMLVRAYRQNAPTPDSVIRWLATVSAGGRGRPVLGTAQALVSSGDLRLIKDDSLRAAIPTYIARSEQYVETLRSLEEDFQAQRELLSDVVDVNQAVLEAGSPLRTGRPFSLEANGVLGTRYEDSVYSPLPATADRTPFPINVNRFLADKKAYQALDRMAWSKWAHKAVRGRLRKTAEELRDQIERSIDR